MTKRKFSYIEEAIDENGVLRKYGYCTDGAVVLLNLVEVAEIYRMRKLGRFRSVV